MLSDDRDNREKAKSAAIKCSSVRDYVAGLTDAPELADMVVTAREATEAHAKADGKIEYEEVSEIRQMTVRHIYHLRNCLCITLTYSTLHNFKSRTVLRTESFVTDR